MKAETLLPLGKLDPGLEAPASELDLTTVGQDAQRVESLGYHALLMEETKHDPFQVLALAANATRSVRIGTSVAIAFARSPFVMAQAAWTLQNLSRGRFELGLGSQVRGHIRRRFGMQWHAPGPWMRSYVGALHAIWHSWQNKTPLNYESEHYQLNLSVPLFTPAPIEHPNIPVLVAAVNPYMCQVAAEVAQGVRLHPVCTPRYIAAELLPKVEVGLAQATQTTGQKERAVGEFEVCLKPLIATAADTKTLAERMEVARRRLAFYCSTPAYQRAFAAADLQDLCEELARLSKQQRWDAMAERIDDEILHEWVVVATYDDLAATIKARYAHLIDRIEVSIPLQNEEDHQILAGVINNLNQDA